MRIHFMFFATCVCMSTICARGADTKIYVSPGKFKDYYHIQFDLTADNCELTVPVSERKPKYKNSNTYTFSQGGQFEVFIRKNKFPVPAPHTKREFLILRMPSTDLKDANATHFIAAKRKLFERIQKMKTEDKGKVQITVELNPYINVLKKEPLSLELSGRNIFFRHAHSQYIDYAGPLNKKQSSK